MASLARHINPDRHPADESQGTLRETLNTLLEITGATAGWIGLLRPDGHLVFPARAGSFSEAWLTYQQGQQSVWGFAIGEEPMLLNQLPPLGMFGEPPLRNLLSCLLRRGAKPAGHVIVANKPTGFTAHDVTAVHTTAALLSRQLFRHGRTGFPLSVSTEVLRLALDQIQDGILMIDHTGLLVFANITWAQWTGYAREELCDRPAPFPFWVSHADLAALDRSPCVLPDTWLSGPANRARPLAGAGTQGVLLPFRHRNHSLFWCHVETTTAEIVGQAVTIAVLRRLPADRGTLGSIGPESAIAAPQAPLTPSQRTAVPPVQNALELSIVAESAAQTTGLALLLRSGGGVDFWDERWEELTGLTLQDLAGVSGELFLDWLLPRQSDRDFVADLFHQRRRGGSQALLEIAARTGTRRLLCTFLPVRSATLRQASCASQTDAPTAQAEARSSRTNAWLLWACDPTRTRCIESRGGRR